MLVLSPRGLRLSDVTLLRAFLAAAQQQQCGSLTPCIVHTVARAIINPEFPDATTHGMCIAKIAETHTRQPSTNPGTHLTIAQPTEPFCKGHMPLKRNIHLNGVWLRFTHSSSVAYRQHTHNRRDRRVATSVHSDRLATDKYSTHGAICCQQSLLESTELHNVQTLCHPCVVEASVLSNYFCNMG